MTQSGIHILIGSNAENHTNIAKDSGDDDTLDDNQLQDAPGFGADSFADTKFMGALFHRYQHDIRDTHDATQQREESYNP